MNRLSNIVVPCVHLLCTLFFPAASIAQQLPPVTSDLPERFDGDIGLGAYTARSIIRGGRTSTAILPYANFDYGRLFARIDTFGIKTAKLGNGYLELATRYEQDGFKTNTTELHGLTERHNSAPLLGLSTVQETPVGAFVITAFRDVGKSKAGLGDLTYIGSIEASNVTIYPQIGVEYLSKKYVGYYYGISPTESAASGYATYQGGRALNPFIAALLEVRLSEDWNLNLFIRRRWLAGSIRDSPIVSRGSGDNIFISLSYRLK